MQGVKFNPEMDTTVPQCTFGVVLDVAAEFNCNSAHDLAQLINTCYTTIKDTKKADKLILSNQKLYMNIAIAILYHGTAMEYELHNKTINFNRTQIKSKLNLDTCSEVIAWFLQNGVGKLTTASPNPEGTIQIT